MTLSSGTFLIVLLFVYCVINVNGLNKRSPRELLDDDRRTLKSNHPPIQDTTDGIPDTVLYENDEPKIESLDKTILDRNDNNDEPTKVILTQTEVTKAVNNYFSTQEDLKSEARSLKVKIPVAVTSSENTDAQNNGTIKVKSNKKGNNRTKTQRRRLQQVRKLDINKNVKNPVTNESSKALQEENKHTTQRTIVQTPVDKAESTTKYVDKSQKRTRTRDPVVAIIESENFVYSHSGNFHYSYEGADGTKAFERGELKQSENGGSTGEAVQGSFSYTDKDGNDFSLSYTADENGYRPVGAHLPTPPPIPPEIQAALRLLATKTTPEPVTEKLTKSY